MSEKKQQTIAEELSAARQARGLDLEEVHRQSGISSAILQGMEAGQFDVVEPVFVRLALKAYAEFLDLDPEPLLTRFDQQHGRAFQSRQRPAVLLSQSKPKRRLRTPLLAIGLVLAVCCLLVVAYYFFGDKTPAPLTAPTQADPTPTESQPTATLNDTLLVQSSTEPAASDAPSTADTSATAAATQTTELPSVVLELEARDSTWVQIHWDDAAENFEGIVPPGQRHRFEARDHFVVLSTRPHGLRYWLDGQLLGDGQLGDPSQVLHFRAAADGIKILGTNLNPLTEEASDAQP